MSERIPAPKFLLGEPGKPYVVKQKRLTELEKFLADSPMHVVQLDASSVRNTEEFVAELKEVVTLTFPDTSWSILEDAADDIDEEWTFPLALIVRGYNKMLTKSPEAALSAMWQLCNLSEGIRREGQQFDIYFVI